MPYDPATGAGSIGVEFAGTAVSSSGFKGSVAATNKMSQGLVADNRELQWNEGRYRGYYELHISPAEIVARYYGECGSSLSMLFCTQRG
jgi:alkaline phosphatase D